MTGWSKARRRLAASIVASLAAAVAVLLALPLASLGSTNPLSKLSSDLNTALNGATTSVQSTVQKVAASTTRSSTVARPSATSSSAPRQSSSSTYTPPGYGTNPHGQGTVASLSLAPSQTRPYTYSPGGSSSQRTRVSWSVGAEASSKRMGRMTPIPRSLLCSGMSCSESTPTRANQPRARSSPCRMSWTRSALARAGRSV